MNIDRKNKLLKNIVFGFGGQFIVLILGIIIPRIMLTSYGSDVNGLIGTVTQIFTYMALFEAGIGQAARNALYKPIAENDRGGISYITSVAQSYFRKITLYYGIGVIILSCALPIVIKSQVGDLTIFMVVLLQGLSGVVSFYFIQTQTTILASDGRGYINNGINVVNQILCYSVRIILASLGVNIAFLQLMYFIITLVKVVVYKIYFSRNYSWIDYKASPKNAKLKDRNAYIVTEIAWTMFSSTDMIVLSIFVSTQLSSVYSIYNLVFTNINVLLNAVYSSVVYILGQTYHDNLNKYAKIHDIFTSVFLGGMTILMSIAYVLIIPFVELYTQGVTDIEYAYPALPVLFCLVQIISWSRYVTGNLTAVAGYAKYTGGVSMIEAIINVVLSVVLVQQFGIVGVLIATVVALPLKVVYCTYLSDKKILHRSYKRSLCIMGCNYSFFAIVVFCSNFIIFPIDNYFEFIKYGIVVTLAFTIVGVGLNICANKDCIEIVKQMRQ